MTLNWSNQKNIRGQIELRWTDSRRCKTDRGQADPGVAVISGAECRHPRNHHRYQRNIHQRIDCLPTAAKMIRFSLRMFITLVWDNAWQGSSQQKAQLKSLMSWKFQAFKQLQFLAG